MCRSKMEICQVQVWRSHRETFALDLSDLVTWQCETICNGGLDFLRQWPTTHKIARCSDDFLKEEGENNKGWFPGVYFASPKQPCTTVFEGLEIWS